MAAAVAWAGPGPGPVQLAQSPVNPYLEGLAPRNNVELSREMLFTVLEHLSTVVASEFNGTPIRLVAHGGACMLLHPGLHELANRKATYHSSKGENAARRMTTRDVDYIHRSFVTESTSRGIFDAAERLQRCIRATAKRFRLGADWMNSDADVALPMSTDSVTGSSYDPIYAESIKENNIRLYTVFTSQNAKLTIINVTPFWAVALKLVRYSKWDPGDICLILLYGSVARGVKWTAEALEGWIRHNCSAMNYDNWDTARLLDMKQKIKHAVILISSIGKSIMAQPGDPLLLPVSRPARGGSVTPANAEVYMPSGAHILSTSSSGSIGSFARITSQTAGWDGPASDVIQARTRTPSPIPFHANGGSDPLLGDYSVLSPLYPNQVTTDGETPSRKIRKRIRQSEWVMERRYKYMLRAEDPDDSDEESDESSGSDTDTIDDGHTSFNLRPRNLDSRQHSWHSSTSTVYSIAADSWTQSQMSLEPAELDNLSLSTQSAPPFPTPSVPENDSPWFPVSHSQSWPVPEFRSPKSRWHGP